MRNEDLRADAISCYPGYPGYFLEFPWVGTRNSQLLTELLQPLGSCSGHDVCRSRVVEEVDMAN